MIYTDEQIQAAVSQYGSQRKAAAALRLNRRTVERRLAAITRGTVHTDSAETYIITSAVNATPVNLGFWRTLKTYAAENKAQIIVIPMRYKNPTSRDEDQESDEWWAPEVTPYLVSNRTKIANVQLLADIKIQPTAITPINSWKTVSGQDHAILGHTKVALSSVPTCHGEDAKLVMTTGSCTVENYSDTHAGAKGAFHHVLAAVVLEVEDGHAYLRHVTAEKCGAFIDLDTRYTPNGTANAKAASVLTMGDIHAAQVDNDVLDATETLCERISPVSIVGHDVLDFGCASHHSRIWEKFRRHVNGTASVLKELQQTAAVMDRIAGWASDSLVIVGSNHHDHFTQWLEKPLNGDDLENTIVYHETKAEMFKAIRDGEWLDPFRYWMDELMCRPSYVHWLSLGESFMRHGIEYSFHGHKGPNGARGSTKGFANIGAKVVKGHSHGAEIIDGARSVGTTSKKKMGYNEDAPSGWTHSHDITYANGKQALVHCVNGKFFR